MNVKYLIVTMVETIIKVAVLAAVIVFVFRGATQAYDFGYRVFADEPVSSSGGRTITVGVAENDSVADIGRMLEEKGLIEDAKLFIVQELLSAQHGDLLPGIYDLNTGMTAGEMLEIMATPPAEGEAGTGSGASSTGSQEGAETEPSPGETGSEEGTAAEENPEAGTEPEAGAEG